MAKEKVFGVREVAGFCPSGSEGIYVSRMLVDSESVGAKKINVNHGTIRRGKSLPGGKHPCPYDEVYYILRGRGLLTIEDKTYEVGPDTVAYIRCGEFHRLANTGNTDLEILTIWSLPLRKGVNPVYDERKRLWGTTFKKINDSCPSESPEFKGERRKEE